MPTITGCLKIEYINAAFVATDVTTEILGPWLPRQEPESACCCFLGGSPCSCGIARSRNPDWDIVGAASACADPDPNAIIRIERVRDNPSTWRRGLRHGGWFGEHRLLAQRFV